MAIAATHAEAPAAEEAQEEQEEPAGEQPARDHPRGYVGWIYEETFKDLYQPQAQATEPSEPPADGGADGGAAQPAGGSDEAAAEAALAARSRDAEVDLSAEDAEIAALRASLDQEHARLGDVLGSLHERHAQAAQKDREDAEHLQKRWGLTMREQYPIADSKLRTMLDPEKLQSEGLVHPAGTLQELERKIEIQKGTVPQHDNLLSVSKPEEPNHYKPTATLKLRAHARNIQPTLTDNQRATIAGVLEESGRRRPPAPPVLAAEERAKNREIVKRMQTKINFLKNPRYQADRGGAARGEACPFAISPGSLVFRNYEIGGIYELDCEFRNTTQVGRRIRVLPCSNPSFSIGELRYDGDGGGKPAGSGAVVAPGMAARLAVRFAPSTLNDVSEELEVGTEVGDFKLPLLARRVQPKLELHQPVDCGCILAGQAMDRTVRLMNRGGEGSFRLVPAESVVDPSAFRYEERGEETAIASPEFSVSPASFYLEAGQGIELQIQFAGPEVGKHECPLLVECDNGVKVPLNLVGITDAVRLELVRWPTSEDTLRPREPVVGVSPWAHVPWQLTWLDPGSQVGGVEAQSITISNGGYLPVKVQWRLAQPPRSLSSRLSVGDQPRLTPELLNGTRNWSTCSIGSHGSRDCPFTVQPAFAVVQPFSTAEFVFSFHAHEPVGRRSTAFACLEATEIPATGQCLLDYGRLLDLQAHMQPEGYQRGLPLFGGAVSGRFDLVPPAAGRSGPGTASCTVTAVCLQGMSVRPSVSCWPPAITLPGTVLPFVAQERELRLRNTGSLPAHFRVRLSSAMGAASPGTLWVLNSQEAGPRPLLGDIEEEDQEVVDPVQQALKRQAGGLSSQWPPMPPQGAGSQGSPGFGASATVVVEPWEGMVPAGQETVLKVIIRAPRELDIDGQFTIDLPISLEAETDTPPLEVAVVGAVRSPRVGLRHTSIVDYGVVRAHAQHTQSLKVSNPSDLPMLVRLRKHKEKDEDDNAASLRPTDPLNIRMSAFATPSYTISAHQPPFKPEPEHCGSAKASCDPLGIFPLSTHQEIVDLFTASVERGSRSGYTPVPNQSGDGERFEPWVHARSGCLDKSGRRPSVMAAWERKGEAEREEGQADDFIFKPEVLVLWPRETAEVDVTLRTGGVGKYYALVEAVGFDSLHTQCVEVHAEVQLPRLHLSTQHCYFPVTYAGTPSEPLELQLRNDSDLPASFHWAMPSKPSGGLEVQITPSEGTLEPRGELALSVVAQPTRLPEGGQLARLACPLFAHEVLQPTLLLASAKVYGPEVDYAVTPVGELAPKNTGARRASGEFDGTHPVTTGRAKRGLPIVDFGEMELLKSKSMQVVLYNRTGIGTPFTVKVKNYPDEHALDGPRAHACQLDEDSSSAASKPQRFDFSSEPRAVPSYGLDEEDARAAPSAARGRCGTSGSQRPSQSKSRSTKFEPKARRSQGSHIKVSSKKKRFLLDDKHEKQGFRSSGGAALAQLKEEKEQGIAALQSGKGWVVQVQTSEDVLQPFGSAVITVTCLSDLPGLMEDELILNIPELAGHADGEDFRIPVRLISYGNPLFLPEQQVGLNLVPDPPQLLCGIIVPSEKLVTKRFRVGNNSSAKMKIAWHVYPSRQLESAPQDRQLLTIALCKKQGELGEPFADVAGLGDEDLGGDAGPEGEAIPDDEMPCCFRMWAREPPEVQDPFVLEPGGESPVKIEPPEAVIPIHGATWFTVTMFASKATTAAGNHYHYKLVGKGSFAEERRSAAPTPGTEGGTHFERTRITSRSSEVRCLPAVPLDPADLHDSDSDAEGAESEARKLSRASVSVIEEAGNETAMPSPIHKELLADDPDAGVVSTIIIDCLGDCILPRLVVDKKSNPAVEDYQQHSVDAEVGIEGTAGAQNCPVFKFTHSVLSPPMKKTSGATHGAFPASAQIPGVVSYMVRNITMSNPTACNIACRFRVDGPFRIREIAQLGRPPVRPLSDAAATRKRGAAASFVDPSEDPIRQLFTIAKLETVTLQVEFALDLVSESEWKQHRTEHTFHGDIIAEYPRDLADGGLQPQLDMQRVHLVGTSRRPALRVTVVPRQELDKPLQVDLSEQPPWSEAQPVVVDFGRVHVEAATTQRRSVLLSNVSNVLARWQLMHVGRKKRGQQEIGQTTREEEEARASDDKDVFEFDVTEGELLGPSKDGILPESKERQPHWCPPMPGVTRAPAGFEEEKYEPQRITIAFKPRRNELYKCKFRMQVESGLAVDFICRGFGSYDEEDDAMDFLES